MTAHRSASRDLDAKVGDDAGIEKSQPLLENDEASWERTLAVYLKGPLLCMKAAARRINERGGSSIVNISSTHEAPPHPQRLR